MSHQVIRIIALAFLMISTAVSAQTRDYSRLDPKPYDPKVDINMDMFMSHWKDSMPRHEHGGLIVRDIFTQNKTGDPLKPRTKGAILTHLTGYMHGTLYQHSSTTPSTLDGEQKIFYIYDGEGTITAGGETADVYRYTGVLIPEGLEFAIKNTSDKPLKMYIVVEPVPANFKPRKTMLVRYENDLPISSSNGHWVNITKTLFRKNDGLAIITGVSPVWLDPMTMAQPHASLPPQVDVLWMAVEGKLIRC